MTQLYSLKKSNHHIKNIVSSHVLSDVKCNKRQENNDIYNAKGTMIYTYSIVLNFVIILEADSMASEKV